MVEIATAVLAETPEAFAHDLALAAALGDRIQFDIADGEFAPNKTLNLVQLYWPDSIRADLHLMVTEPLSQLETVIALNPHLVIFHAETLTLDAPELRAASEQLHVLGIKVGLALLPTTTVVSVAASLSLFDHVLVFTGELGHYGGTLNADCLPKIGEIKQIDSQLEVGVDGGINPDTAPAVVAAGADVLNVGGYLQGADNPEAAYATLKAAL
ncbi:MAG: hypothetical protein WD467_03630 [Candidatus Saccharimonadales bacterium]